MNGGPLLSSVTARAIFVRSVTPQKGISLHNKILCFPEEPGFYSSTFLRAATHMNINSSSVWALSNALISSKQCT